MISFLDHEVNQYVNRNSNVSYEEEQQVKGLGSRPASPNGGFREYQWVRL
ncbi:hypothetical protein [Xenorhabdus sp. Sc-CR9]